MLVYDEFEYVGVRLTAVSVFADEPLGITVTAECIVRAQFHRNVRHVVCFTEEFSGMKQTGVHLCCGKLCTTH